MTIFDQIRNAKSAEEMALILSGHYLHSYEAYIGWLQSSAYTEEEMRLREVTKNAD